MDDEHINALSERRLNLESTEHTSKSTIHEICLVLHLWKEMAVLSFYTYISFPWINNLLRMEIFTEIDLAEILGWNLSLVLFHIFSGFCSTSIWIKCDWMTYMMIWKVTEGLYCCPWTLALAKHFINRKSTSLNEASKIIHWCSV